MTLPGPDQETDTRALELRLWLEGCFGPCRNFRAISGDASFRRYFRFEAASGRTIIGVDAPPDKEDSSTFLKVAEALAAAGVRIPTVFRADLGHGWLALEDLGDVLLLQVLNTASVEVWYDRALAMLHDIARASLPAGWPRYGAEKLQQEMGLFGDWLLEEHLAWRWRTRERQLWQETVDALTGLALDQPLVCVHRDYHSRNLMCLEDGSLATLDFQDAVRGPVTYDAVSLLKDCYVKWPQEKVDAWLLHYRDALAASGMAMPSGDEWLFWSDTMGMQRHLKAAGIFARLWHRDGKAGYLADVPRTLSYLVDAGRRHDAFRTFGAWIADDVLPRFLERHPEWSA